METALTISQIIFFSVFSLVIITFFIIMVSAGYRINRILRKLEEIARDVHDLSDEARARIKDISEKLSLLPIISFFAKKAGAKRNTRKKVDKNKTQNQ
jgi:hypothetical protein